MWKSRDVRERAVDLFALISGPFVLAALIVVVVYGNPVLIVGFAAWVTLFGTIGAVVAPRKGRTPWSGFVLAGIFGIFGIAYLVVQPDTEQDGDIAWRQSALTYDAAAALHSLSDLHDRGAVTDAEFEAKKRELLARM